MPLCLWQFRELEDGPRNPMTAVLAILQEPRQPGSRLIVAYLSDWTPEVSELALELVRRQRTRGREVLIRYPLHTSMPLPLAHNRAEPQLVCGNLDGRAGDTLQGKARFWWVATTTVSAGRLSECVQQEVSIPSFLHLDGKSGEETESPSCVHVAERTSEPVLTPMRITFNDTKLDPGSRQALTAGIKTAFGRLHVNFGHPTTDDLIKCLAAGGGTRKAQRAVKCLRCSTCEKVSRSPSDRPCRIPK